MSFCGSRVEFPPFEGKFQKFQQLKQEHLQTLPKKPSTKKVYIVYGVSNVSVACKDGWNWGKGNKSNKANFTNQRSFTSGLKYRCKEENCEAIRFIDTIFSHGVSRVYYENEHRHSSETNIPEDTKLSRERITKETSLKETIFYNEKCPSPSSEEDDPFTPSHQKPKRRKINTILLSDDDDPPSKKKLGVEKDPQKEARKNEVDE